MALVQLSEMKQHLRILHDFDDTTIQIYLDSAEQHIKNFLGTDYEKIVDAPAPIKSAILLLGADLYLNRSMQADQALNNNRAFDLLLNPYITKEVF
ncbi:head-tail connector protein [Acinetobacter sp. ULE_I001]|uniref:head-tail connector protein n=1 Tax=Acinetobacter TaxID=469 RepID=UPI0026543E70|nr:head-tail connector protein [Acinetobacter sp.]MDN5623789.1 head-tail connector protein [Acinetobacter sp.]MDN5648758.1 head-tail connector protein [Acinetobacter sp.]